MDPIASMFTQIRNAQSARHENLVVPFSKIKMAILEILKLRQQISDFRIVGKDSAKSVKKQVESKTKILRIEIDLNEHLLDIQRVSRPSRRVYTSSAGIPRPKRPKSMFILSTSKGVLEGEDARKKGLGGELIAEVK